MSTRLKQGNFLSRDNPVISFIAGLGVSLAADETPSGDVELTIGRTTAGGALIVPFSKSGVLTTGVGVGRFLVPFGGTIISAGAAVNTAPTGASLICDVNKNGTTVFTTQANRPTVAISAFQTAAFAVPDVTTFIAGDYFTVDIDQVGSSVAGSDLVVQVVYSLA